MAREPKAKEFALVVRGTFNPKSFQPSWFERTKLLRPGEAEKADVKIAHSTIVDFSLDWGRIQVTSERFFLATQDEGLEGSVIDLVAGTFKLMAATPVTAVGFNRLIHFSVDSEAEWHDIGHKLVPKKDLWDNVLTEPGMLSVTVQGKQAAGKIGSVNIRVEPSKQFRPGVYVDINDHYQVNDPAGKEGTGADLVELLKTVSRESSKKTAVMIKELMEKL